MSNDVVLLLMRCDCPFLQIACASCLLSFSSSSEVQLCERPGDQPAARGPGELSAFVVNAEVVYRRSLALEFYLLLKKWTFYLYCLAPSCSAAHAIHCQLRFFLGFLRQGEESAAAVPVAERNVLGLPSHSRSERW